VYLNAVHGASLHVTYRNNYTTDRKNASDKMYYVNYASVQTCMNTA